MKKEIIKKEYSKELQLAIDKFRDFVMSGKYFEKTESKKNVEAAKAELKNLLINSEERYHVFKKHGMVAKFVPRAIKETDHRGLIEEILCYIRSEALSRVITFNKEKMENDGVSNVIVPYQYPVSYFVRPSLNKQGKSFNFTLKENFQGENIDNLLAAIKHYSNLEKSREEEYKECMSEILAFMDKDMFKVVTDIGSISKIPKDPDYNVYQLIEELGEDFVLNYGEVRLTELEQWINIGALPENITSEYQTVVDIRLDFFVMTLESEQKMFEALNIKRQKSRRYTA